MSEIKIGKKYKAKCDCFMNSGYAIIEHVLKGGIVTLTRDDSGMLCILLPNGMNGYIFTEQFKLCFEKGIV